MTASRSETDRAAAARAIGVYAMHPQTVVSALIVYYWALAYSRPSGALAELTGLHYAAFVVPIALFIAFWAAHRLWTGMRLQVPSILLCLFIAACAVVSLVRRDLSTLFSVGIAFGAAAALLDLRISIPRHLVNVLFLLSLLAGQLCFAIGWSQYGIIPWASEFLAREGLAWRVSLFPSVPESAFVSLLVFVLNRAAPRSAFRNVMLVLSLYFLIMSGLRTALVAFILIEAYYWFLARRPAVFRVMFLAIVAAMLPILAVSMETVKTVPALGGGVLSQYVLRSNDADVEESELSFSRLRIWTQHLSLFSSSPLIGVGTFDFDAAFVAGEARPLPTTGSESWLTAWAARTGSIFAVALTGFGWVAARAAARSNPIALASALTWYVASLAYGSVLAPYDLVSVLLLAGMSQWKRGSGRDLEGIAS